MRVLIVLGVSAAVLVAAAFAVSFVRSDTPGRIACPVTGQADCTDPDCPMGSAERGVRDLISSIRVRVSGLDR